MTLAELSGALAEEGLTTVSSPWAGRHTTVTGIAYDSRRVEDGQVFVALKGLRADGTSFVRQALERGKRLRRSTEH